MGMVNSHLHASCSRIKAVLDMVKFYLRSSFITKDVIFRELPGSRLKQRAGICMLERELVDS